MFCLCYYQPLGEKNIIIIKRNSKTIREVDIPKYSKIAPYYGMIEHDERR